MEPPRCHAHRLGLHSRVAGDHRGCRDFAVARRCDPSSGRTCFESGGSVVAVVPATVVLSVLESRPREASFGTRTRHLRVVDAVTGSRASFRRSILQNTLQIGVRRTIWMLLGERSGGGEAAAQRYKVRTDLAGGAEGGLVTQPRVGVDQARDSSAASIPRSSEGSRPMPITTATSRAPGSRPRHGTPA